MVSAAGKAYETLKQRVVGGTYAPGAQLKEEHLARELRVSRTPVRAALKRLVEDGLATADPNRGVRVSEWTDFDIEETFELRGLLESHAAELAARRGGARLADRLDDLNQQMDRAIAAGGAALPERLQEINSRFHRAILEGSGSPRLRGMLAGLIDMPIVIRSHFISTLQDKVQSLQHHRDLASAVRARDGELARQVMQLHLRVASHRFKRQRGELSGSGVRSAFGLCAARPIAQRAGAILVPLGGGAIATDHAAGAIDVGQAPAGCRQAVLASAGAELDALSSVRGQRGAFDQQAAQRLARRVVLEPAGLLVQRPRVRR